MKKNPFKGKNKNQRARIAAGFQAMSPRKPLYLPNFPLRGDVNYLAALAAIAGLKKP